MKQILLFEFEELLMDCLTVAKLELQLVATKVAHLVERKAVKTVGLRVVQLDNKWADWMVVVKVVCLAVE